LYEVYAAESLAKKQADLKVGHSKWYA